jgi:hypothetical protein
MNDGQTLIDTFCGGWHLTPKDAIELYSKEPQTEIVTKFIDFLRMKQENGCTYIGATCSDKATLEDVAREMMAIDEAVAVPIDLKELDKRLHELG